MENGVKCVTHVINQTANQISFALPDREVICGHLPANEEKFEMKEPQNRSVGKIIRLPKCSQISKCIEFRINWKESSLPNFRTYLFADHMRNTFRIFHIIRSTRSFFDLCLFFFIFHVDLDPMHVKWSSTSRMKLN